MHIKQLLLTLSLSAVIAQPAYAFGEFERHFSLTTLSMVSGISTLIAGFAFSELYEYNAQRKALENEIPGLTQALEEAQEETKKGQEKHGQEHYSGVNIPEIYAQFATSAQYDKLMELYHKAKYAQLATGASAFSALAFAILHSEKSFALKLAASVAEQKSL